VIGRKSGRTISIPVWFVLEGEKLYLHATFKGPSSPWNCWRGRRSGT
jgi:hypothetical protein